MDQLTPSQLAASSQTLSSLNPRADIYCSAEGDVDPAFLLESSRFVLTDTLQGAEASRHLGMHLPESHHHEEHETSTDSEASPHEHPHHHHHHAAHGLDTVIFRSRVPADEDRLLEVLQKECPSVIRAKGFYWSSEKPEWCGVVSLAGGVIRAGLAGPWFVEMLAQQQVTLDEMPDIVKASWQNPRLGDRRQEIVLIGPDLDKDLILGKLEQSLVADTPVSS